MKQFIKNSFIIISFIILGSVSVLASDLYFVQSLANPDLSWDMSGYHFNAERKGGKVKLYDEDKGADRFIKIIPHESKKDYVFFQPQHSFYVADIVNGAGTPGAKLQLWDKGKNNTAQMFKMIAVSGKANTYYVQNYSSGLYLTAHEKAKAITQEYLTIQNNQEWYFKKVNPDTMAQPTEAYMYSLENVLGKKFVDSPGSAPNQDKDNAKLQTWDMDYEPDRYIELFSKNDGYFEFHSLHSTELWTEEKINNDWSYVRLKDRNESDEQRFKFKYAGEPLTYYIINKKTGKYMDVNKPSASQNGAPLRLIALDKEPDSDSDADNHRKWRLHMYNKWQLPPKDQDFFVKSTYIDQYWDISGDGNVTSKRGQNFQMWDFHEASDRKYKIIPSGDNSWVYVQVQSGNSNSHPNIDVPSGKNDNALSLTIWDAHGGNNQKFAVQFTSPTTFLLRTNNWKTLDIKGGTSNKWKKKGADLIQYTPHFHANQQFTLIYAGGSNKGSVYKFPELNEKTIFFTTNLNQEDEENLKKINSKSYSYYQNENDDIIFGISAESKPSGGYRINVTKVVETGDKIEVYVKETSPQPGKMVTQAFTRPKTSVRISSSNKSIVVKSENGYNYSYQKLDLDTKDVNYSTISLNSEQREIFSKNQDNSYSYYKEGENDTIFAIFSSLQSSSGYKIKINKVVEVKDHIEVYVEETSPQPGKPVLPSFQRPEAFIKINTSKSNIVVKSKNGYDYSYQKLDLDTKDVNYSTISLNSEQIEIFSKNQDNSYSYYKKGENDTIFAIYSTLQPSSGYYIKINKVVEVKDHIEVYVEETSPQGGTIVNPSLQRPKTFIKINTSKSNIVVKSKNGNRYTYFTPLN